jgi:transposase InsO family protein
MSVRRLIVQVDPSSLNVTEFCAAHGVSTWFFWDLRRRFARDGDAALEPRSRAPRRVANKTPGWVEDAIVAKRKELRDAGLDAGSATIAYHLGDLDGAPSESTIYRVLKRRGFITPDPAKTPTRALRRFQAQRANELWQLDDHRWPLADGTEVHIFDVVDDCSRLAVAAHAVASMTGPAAFDAFAAAAGLVGWPTRFLSDNAPAFRSYLADSVAHLGVGATHSRPHHPQTNGKVERFHQTEQRWLRQQPPAETIDELQAQLDVFRHIYNHQRPHRSLGRATPAHVWTTTPKSGPVDRPIGTTTTHQARVRGGRLRVSHYEISVGAAHNGHTATAVITALTCHIFIGGHLIRTLTINPTRQAQPLYDRPGRPPRLP